MYAVRGCGQLIERIMIAVDHFILLTKCVGLVWVLTAICVISYLAHDEYLRYKIRRDHGE